jgi:beta-glucosidase
MTASSYEFPPDFLWGAATSAYQIEGSPLADGAGMNIWHRFSRTPGATHDGATGDIACDHYNRWEQDLDLMKELGLRAYRFSIAWARLLPEGTGRVNRAGLAFYERLVDGLLARNITPLATLYHWDLPAALDDRGGWLNPDVASWFAEYTRVAAGALSDRVPMWVTLNEPWVVMDGGYMHGVLAPGHRNIFEAPRVTQNLMRAHGAGVQAFRAQSRAKIGLVVNIEPKYAASESEADRAATARADAYMNRQYLDPALLGAYPDELREIFGDAWPEPSGADLALVRQELDFVGINYYTRAVHRADASVPALAAARVAQPRHTHTEMGWEVHAPALTDTLNWFKARYGDIPLYVTENGAAFYDAPQPDGSVVEDPLRVAYYRDHLRAAHRAIAGGVDLRGYFAWSLLDNYEWSYGYSKRFGIVHVDFETQRRTPKRSARYYADVIRTNGRELDGP